MSLFDEYDRTDERPQDLEEADYDFYNRAAGSDWDNVRATIEKWVDHVGAEHRSKVVRDLKSEDRQQVHSTLWHLYLNESLREMGFTVDYEPSVPGLGGNLLTPDLLIERDGFKAVVEATVVFDEVNYARRVRAQQLVEKFLNDKLAELDNQPFVVVDFQSESNIQDLKLATMAGRVGEWLDSLGNPAASRTLSITEGEWSIEFADRGLTNKARGERLVGIVNRGLYLGIASDDAHAIRDVIKKKTRKYEHLGIPVIVAVQVERIFARDSDIKFALYGDFGPSEAIERQGWVDRSIRGDFNGVWATKEGPDRQWGPGIIAYGRHFEPALVDEIRPCVWINPWATEAITGVFGWDEIIADPNGPTGIRHVSHEQPGL